MKLTEQERRTLLDLLDEEHARDRRTFEIGRTTISTFRDQQSLYQRLRAKLISVELEEAPAEVSTSG